MDAQKLRAAALMQLGATSVSVAEDLSFVIEPEDVDIGDLEATEASLVLPARKDAILAVVNARRDAIIVSGYRHNFGGSAGIRTLDQRTEADAINWLGLKGMVDGMIASGQGSAPIAIRDASNETFSASAQVVSGALMTMAQWRGAAMTRSWELKDEIEAAEDEAELDAINIDAGWPGE